MGYAFGVVISDVTADLFGVDYAIFLIGGLTIISSIIIKFRIPETIKMIKECIEVDEVKKIIQQNRKYKLLT